RYQMSRFVSRRSIAIAGFASTVLALTSCGGGGQAADADGPVQMWARATTAAQSQALVDAYNEAHDQQIELTVVPTDNYLQKVGVAAGSNELPCLLASDVVYMPNFIEQGLYLDITEQTESLEYFEALAPGHIDLSSKDDVIYGVPHNVSV